MSFTGVIYPVLLNLINFGLACWGSGMSTKCIAGPVVQLAFGIIYMFLNYCQEFSAEINICVEFPSYCMV